MAKYPGSYDTTIPLAVDGVTPVSSSLFNSLRDAIIAVEIELGLLPKSVYGSVRNRLDSIEAIVSGGSGGSVQLAQDLGNSVIAPYVIGLYGNPISSTPPVINYALIWSGVAWEAQAVSHNTKLIDLQGGTSGQYYHLTSAQHTWLTEGVTTTYWSETKGGTGNVSYTTGDILYSDGSNSLTKLAIGSTGEVLTVSGGVPVWSADSSPTAHNALTGIQGGSYADGYYHLTSYQHTWLTDGYSDGYWNEIKGGTGLNSYTTGDIIYASTTDTLTTLPIGTDGYQLSINGSSIEWSPGYYHAIFVGKIGSVAASTDGYLLQNLSISSTEDFPAFVTPIQSKAAKMRVTMSQAPGAGESVTVTLRKNETNTSLAVTVSDSDTTGSNLTNLISMIQGGSKMTVRVQTTSGSVVEDLSVVLVLYPDNIMA